LLTRVSPKSRAGVGRKGKLGIEGKEKRKKRDKRKKKRIDRRRSIIDLSYPRGMPHKDKSNNTKKDQHLTNLKIDRWRSTVDMSRRLWWVGQSKQYNNLVNVSHVIHTPSNFPSSFLF
jgi:hypothetical protein